MQQESVEKMKQELGYDDYSDFFKFRRTTFAGFPFDFVKKDTFDDNAEQREAFYEDLWKKGGFNFWLATYQDMLFNKEANVEAYRFWNKKTRARITDPVKREILAPVEMPHYFGTKRPSLEQCYYEMMDKPNVKVVDLKKTPIVEFTEKGIKTEDGTVHELDMIGLATGFDSVTGGMKNMGLKNSKGEDMNEKWKDGYYSYLGTTCNGYPNMFFLYGVHGPTAFSNGPTCVEVQADWIIDAIQEMKKQNIYSIEATRDSELEWHKKIQDLSNETLFPLTKSWYMGNNIPGKKVEQLNYAGGFPLYQEELWATLPDFKGFDTIKESEMASSKSETKSDMPALTKVDSGVHH